MTHISIGKIVEELNSNRQDITQEEFDQFFSLRWRIFFVWMFGLFFFLNPCVWVIEGITDTVHDRFIDNILTFGIALPLSFALAAGIFALVELKRLYSVNKTTLNVLTSFRGN